MQRPTKCALAAWGLAAALSTAFAGMGFSPAARAADAPRAAYDFEDGAQGFTPIVMKDGSFAVDTAAMVSVAKDKNLVKSGTASLAYAYTVEPKVIRALAAELRAPANAAGIRFWVRMDTTSGLTLSLREEGGATHDMTFLVPGNEWTQVALNWDELTADGKKLDPAQIRGLSLIDLATVFGGGEFDLKSVIPDFKPARTVWLDDFSFVAERPALSMGLAKTENALVVDNFENGVLRWLPVRIDFNNAAPSFTLFPTDATQRIVPEAAGPGQARTPVEAGGKGLRFAYKRGPMQAFALNYSLEKRDLSRADRLRLHLNMSQKSLVSIQVKEKDGSEYQHLLMPENTVGWQNLDVALSSLTLSDNSQDENNALDPGQIKEMTLIDATALLGQGDGDVTMEVDAISFSLK